MTNSLVAAFGVCRGPKRHVTAKPTEADELVRTLASLLRKKRYGQKPAAFGVWGWGPNNNETGAPNATSSER
jgi:hypothetical protein